MSKNLKQPIDQINTLMVKAMLNMARESVAEAAITFNLSDRFLKELLKLDELKVLKNCSQHFFCFSLDDKSQRILLGLPINPIESIHQISQGEAL